MRDPNAAQHDVIAFDKGMHIKAVSDAYVSQRCMARDFRPGKIVVRCQLHFACLAFEHTDWMPGPFSERSIVGKIVASRLSRAPMRRHDQIETESLRSLHDAQLITIERL